MILPALRGYYTAFDLSARPGEGNYILIGCRKCKCQRVLYHKEDCHEQADPVPGVLPEM